MSLLQIEDLKISFHNRERTLEAVKGIGFALEAGETLAVVGESGSGKSVTALSLTRLLPPPPGCQVSGKIHYNDRDVMTMSPRELRGIRGKDIAYIFQEPSTSLNPVFTIGMQIAEAIKLHFPQEKDVTGRVIEALRAVGIRDPEKRHRAYPHELSGGMQQRVMIAMALACEPRILVADEPTTALDVTIQKQIMDLLADLRQKRTMSIILITHNFGIVSGFADRVIVMFRGEIVEAGPTEEVLRHPQHPYTKALIALPLFNITGRPLTGHPDSGGGIEAA
ncbi:MAG: ABC transporter ATP-binding protein [Verrucomicrobiota bacterium JB024]|nr:ABC transporter ATP-binding protein [Verrucomicrobiota bacterium JB024]